MSVCAVASGAASGAASGSVSLKPVLPQQPLPVNQPPICSASQPPPPISASHTYPVSVKHSSESALSDFGSFFDFLSLSFFQSSSQSLNAAAAAAAMAVEAASNQKSRCEYALTLGRAFSNASSK